MRVFLKLAVNLLQRPSKVEYAILYFQSILISYAIDPFCSLAVLFFCSSSLLLIYICLRSYTLLLSETLEDLLWKMVFELLGIQMQPVQEVIVFTTRSLQSSVRRITTDNFALHTSDRSSNLFTRSE